MQVAVLETSFIHVSLNTSLHALLNSQHIQKNKIKQNQTKLNPATQYIIML